MERSSIPVFTTSKQYAERSNKKPVGTFIPHQAITLSELVSRFEKGQRLNVHQNFKPMSQFTEGKIEEETFEEAPPDNVHDIVDVHEYYEDHQQRKSAYFEKKKKEKQAQQGKREQEPPQAKQDPPDPSGGNLSE